MSVFETAAASLLADHNLAEDATYTPAGGTAVAVRVVVSRPDREIGVGLSGLQVPALRASLLVAALPPGAAPGDTLAIGTASYRVRRITRDSAQAVAALDLDPL